jgi:Secretion system C-terminal sorting domain/FG-GAP-like repeat
VLQDKCWGKFYESGLTKKLDLSTSAAKCFGTSIIPEAPRDGLHAGSTVLTFDNDGDGDVEILLGDISFKNINMAINGGTKTAAWMNEQDNAFPNVTDPVNIEIFPTPFLFDANNDGKKDFFAAPNNINSSEDINAAWYYENTGTNTKPAFQLRQKTFLIDEMLDFGSYTAPTFADVDGDGLTDIVVGVGNTYKNNNDIEGHLVLLKNIGTKNNPKFKIIDDNWLNFKQFTNNSFFFAPTFGDIDSDGDQDLFVGESSGALFFVENKGGAGKPMLFDASQLSNNYEYQKIDAGQNSVPQVVDLNRDGLQDLVLGESNGILFYYKNIGTKNVPKFEPNKKSSINIDTLGYVDVKQAQASKGYASPVVMDFNGKFQMFVSSVQGKIAQYNNIDKNLNGTFNLVNPDWGKVREGFAQNIAMTDINNDGVLDLLVGNQRGGLSFYQTNLTTQGKDVAVQEAFSPLEKIRLMPNPASHQVRIVLENKQDKIYNVQIFNSLGQILYQDKMTENSLDLSIETWQKGVYFVNIATASGNIVERLVKAN